MKRRLVAPAVLLALTTQVLADDAMYVHFIDVGQGDATLLEFPCGAVLVDAGGERTPAEVWMPAQFDGKQRLLDYLNRFFERRVDLNNTLSLLVITHPHLDHTRGVDEVLDRFSPRNIVHNGQRGGSGSEGQYAARRYASENGDARAWYVLRSTLDHAIGLDAPRGLSIVDPVSNDCGVGVDPRIRALWGHSRRSTGWEHEAFQDENNHSVVVRVDYGESSILFTGDLEEAREPDEKAGIEHLLDFYAGTGNLDVDVYHVGHHGSHNGTSDDLVEALSPEIAVISMGPACRNRRGFTSWSFAHPRLETIEELERGVSGDRISKSVKVFERFGRPPIERRVTRAIYATGWDGTVVLRATASGAWVRVDDSSPDSCLDE